MSDNQTYGTIRQSRETAWWLFDRLPPSQRRLYAFAPHVFAIRTAPLTDEQLVDLMLRVRDEACRETYGPDHPQIGSRTPERRPRRRLR